MSDAPKIAPPCAGDRDAKVLEQTREHYRRSVAPAQAAYDLALQKARSADRNLHWEEDYKNELRRKLRVAESELEYANRCLSEASPLWVQERRLALLQVAATLVAAHPMFTTNSVPDDFMEHTVLRLADSFEDYVMSGRQPDPDPDRQSALD